MAASASHARVETAASATATVLFQGVDSVVELGLDSFDVLNEVVEGFFLALRFFFLRFELFSLLFEKLSELAEVGTRGLRRIAVFASSSGIR